MSLHYGLYKSRVEALIADLVSETEPAFRTFVEKSLRGGKRIRAILTLSMLDSVLRKEQLGARAVAAVERTCLSAELIHAASLILDDLPCMDDAATRRGRPCVHKQFGEAAAILISGHLLAQAVKLYTAAFKCVAWSDAYVELIDQVSNCLSFSGAAGGQMLDLGIVKDGAYSIRDMIERKTSSLFEIAMLTGYLAHRPHGAGCHDTQQVREAARLFGIAFQIYDDFGDMQEDDETNNYVIARGDEAAYAEFEGNLDKCAGILKQLHVYAPVMDELFTVMRVSVRAKV